ncbi:MAG: tetratricopeptide repeat protein [Spirochaetaceae bacterium]|nr:tetratricopeptide repeat protein [Spirochaetaceae bacterium]
MSHVRDQFRSRGRAFPRRRRGTGIALLHGTRDALRSRGRAFRGRWRGTGIALLHGTRDALRSRGRAFRGRWRGTGIALLHGTRDALAGFRWRVALLATLCGLGAALPAVAQAAATPTPAAAPAVLLAEAERHFADGNRLAGERRSAEAAEQFRAALLRYEAAAAALGGGNGYLLYNIGNTYFRLGDVGRAILYYREAQQLIPADPNLQQSLRHARSLRRDRIEPTAAGGVVRVLFFWHFTVPLRVRAGLLLGAWNLLWLLALLPALATVSARSRRLRQRLHATRGWQRVRRPVLGTVVAVAAVVAVAMGGSVAADLVDSQEDVAVVVAPEVVARRGDGAAYEASFDGALHAGTELVVVERRNDWYQVVLADGRRAWLPEDAVAVVGEGAGARLW